jgi:post-segregation antitoxin (ccd killing protein)
VIPRVRPSGCPPNASPVLGFTTEGYFGRARSSRKDSRPCYHDIMPRKATTVRIPEELADTAEVVARARGVSVNALILEALQTEVDRAKTDEEFMAVLRSHVERDKEILDRLAE